MKHALGIDSWAKQLFQCLNVFGAGLAPMTDQPATERFEPVKHALETLPFRNPYLIHEQTGADSADSGVVPCLAFRGGGTGAPGFLHPAKRALTQDLVRNADVTFAQIGAHREEFDVRAPDGAMLRGWKVRAAKPNGAWVLVFHGVADNRCGMTEHARLLLQRGYNVVMMDSRAHGASDGDMASYGWLERTDSSTTIDELERIDHPRHLFALGNSMGAGIALQAAGSDQRIEAVAAETAFANLQEAAYDYAGLQRWPLLGKTFFAPGAWVLILRGERLAGFPAGEVSPVKAVARRKFPLLQICDGADLVLPCRHSEMILRGYGSDGIMARAGSSAHGSTGDGA